MTQQQAKPISLGTLSVGLAHELNNPAAAVRSNVKNLEAALQTLPLLALKLHQQPLTEEQIAFLSNLYRVCAQCFSTRCDRSKRGGRCFISKHFANDQ